LLKKRRLLIEFGDVKLSSQLWPALFYFVKKAKKTGREDQAWWVVMFGRRGAAWLGPRRASGGSWAMAMRRRWSRAGAVRRRIAVTSMSLEVDQEIGHFSF
jgi:hypothetical protein